MKICFSSDNLQNYLAKNRDFIINGGPGTEVALTLNRQIIFLCEARLVSHSGPVHPK